MHDHSDNDGEDKDGVQDNDDWTEGSCNATIDNYLAEKDFYDTNRDQSLWDKNHNYTQLH